ncbi:MAG: hypothetical protein RDV48_05305 [Candidatus Eremiobacteraeota bacterium]|nr:hypothetical protein [Candidatus Eremiobacteraeota bacterium]
MRSNRAAAVKPTGAQPHGRRKLSAFIVALAWLLMAGECLSRHGVPAPFSLIAYESKSHTRQLYDSPPGPEAVISRYFTPGLTASMRADARRIKGSFGGINIFSSAHYATTFVTGTATLRDVFDARVPGNFQIFLAYAREKFGTDPAAYERFPLAATAFLESCGFDAVLYRPDQFHPVFTDARADTWMFLRDAPSFSSPYYYSSRVKDRRIEVTGGMAMRAQVSSDPLYENHWMYYIPSENSSYRQYCVPGKEENRCNSNVTGKPSDYSPPMPSREAIERREKLGIAPSPLSGRTLRVGGWKSEQSASESVRDGIRFVHDPEYGTWGGWGIYLLPLDREFWLPPAGGHGK